MTNAEFEAIFAALGNLSFAIGYMQSEQPNKCKEMQSNLDRSMSILFELRRRS